MEPRASSATPHDAVLACHLSRRQLLRGAGALGAALVLGEACGSSTRNSRLPASATGGAIRPTPPPAQSPTPPPPLDASALRTALGNLPLSGTLTLPGGGSATIADLSAAGVAMAAPDDPTALVLTNPIAALGFALAVADWSGQRGAIELSGLLHGLPLVPVRLVLPQLPAGQPTDVLGTAVPAGLTLRPGASLLLAGILPDRRVVAGVADPSRPVAAHPRLELAILSGSTLGPLAGLAGATVDAAAGTVTIAGGARVVLTPIDPALATRLVSGAGALFVDTVPLQPTGTKPPRLTVEPAVPVPDPSVVRGAVRVSRATDGRILALSAAGTPVGRAEYIGGVPVWDWLGTGGLGWTLREAAAAGGVRIGTSPHGSLIVNDARYARYVRDQFAVEGLGGDFWASVQAAPGATLDLGYWTARVASARTRNMRVFGYLLDNPNTPTWVADAGAGQQAAAARAFVASVIRQLPDVSTWIAFNEPVATALYGTGIQAFWSHRLGAGFNGFIADTLEWAHAASPSAALIVNENYDDGRDPAITEGMLELTRDLLGRGAPLGGVGMEMHLHYDESQSASGAVFSAPVFAGVLAEYRRLGVPVYVTEFDVDMTGFSGSKADENKVQARFYHDALQTALEGGVRDFAVFGITDDTSWYLDLGKPHADALFLNADYSPKPSYLAMLDVLEQWADLRPV